VRRAAPEDGTLGSKYVVLYMLINNFALTVELVYIGFIFT
jgi:hypothetical protein